MKRLFAVVLSATMLLGMAGCGNKDTDSNNNNSTGGSASGITYSQGVSDNEIIIANSAATSGAFASVGIPFVAGMEAYVKMVNENGGIDGRKLKYVHQTDDEFDAAKGKAALEGIVEDTQAFAVVGHFGTPVVAATLDDLKQYGIPTVYFATGLGQLYATNTKTNADGYNLFPVQPLYSTEGRLLIGYSTGKFDAKKIGVIYTNDDAGMDLYKGITEQAEELNGIEIVAEQVTSGAADVSAAVTSIKNANVDFIIVASIQGTFPTIVKELAAQGVNKDCITTYVNTDGTMADAVRDDIKGRFDVYSTGWVDADDAESLGLFTQWIDEEYASNTFAMTGWISVATFAEGLKRLEGQDITWENYMKAMEEAPLQLPFGAAVDYANGNRWGTQAMTLSKVTDATDEWILGWELVAPMTNISDLLK